MTPWVAAVPEVGRHGGRFFPQDADGWLVNELDAVPLQPEWSGLVAAVVEAVVTCLGPALDGLYLRGSVAEGRAHVRTSDLDAMALVEVVDERDRRALHAVLSDLEASSEVAREITVDLFTLDDLDRSWSHRHLPVVLRAQSRILHGRDHRPALAPARPGPDMVFAAHDLERRRAWLDDALASIADARRRELRLQAFFRAALRAGFELHEVELGRYTRDIDLCAQVLELSEPDRSGLFWDAHRRALVPDDDHGAHAADALMEWYRPAYLRAFGVPLGSGAPERA